jgi:hypothetical protein
MTSIFALSTSIPRSNTKYNAFLDHEVALFPIQHQVLFLASLRDLVQVFKAMIEGLTINQEVIHEDFHNFLDHI